MAQFDLITATEYNTLRTQGLNVIQGKYGRVPLSSAVVGGSNPGVSNTVTEQQYVNLFLDLQAGYVHQTATVSTGALITQFAEGTEIEYSDITDLNTIVSDVVSFSPLVSQSFPIQNFSQSILLTSLGVSTTSVRDGSVSPWNGRINHRVTYNFGSNANFNAYFNAGGLLKWQGSLTGGTTSNPLTKDGDWARIISAAGEIQVGVNFSAGSFTFRTISVNNNGTGSEVALSSVVVSAVPTTVVYSIQGGYSSGGQNIYVANDFQLLLSVDNVSAPTTVVLQAQFNDDDTGTGNQVEPGEVGTPIDEQVTGLLTSTFYTFTPNSQFVIGSTTYPAIVQTPPTGTLNSVL